MKQSDAASAMVAADAVVILKISQNRETAVSENHFSVFGEKLTSGLNTSQN